MRLDKFVLKSTQLTKSEVVTQITKGNVFVNGAMETRLNCQVHEDNKIEHCGVLLVARPFRYMLMHKMANTLSANNDGHYPSLLTALEIKNKDELHIVGRLDADTTGLVLITDDGRWSFNITRPQSDCPKVYRVILAKPINDEAVSKIQQGLLLQGETKPTLAAKVDIINDYEVKLTIYEGRYHQVKRMFFAVGNRVNKLHREQIGNVMLDIPEGQWRLLTHAEVMSFSSRLC